VHASSSFSLFSHLIPLPIAIGTLLLEEKGWKNKNISVLAPLLKERGWGEVYYWEGFRVRCI
jgi:hypothetical protein